MRGHWQHTALHAITIGLEGCWLYALLSLLGSRVVPVVGISGLLTILPVSYVFNALLPRTGWRSFILGGVSWTAAATAALLAVKLQLHAGSSWSDTGWLVATGRAITGMLYEFRPELLILMVSPLLWQLGRRLARTRITFATAVGEFQFGLVVLLILFFVAAQMEADIAHPVLLVMTFFVLGLAGMSLAHALERTTWLSGLFRGRWTALLVVSVILVLLLGSVIAAVADRNLIQVALNVLNWIWELTVKVMALLVSLFPQSEPPDLPPQTPLPGAQPDEGIQLFSMPEWLRDTLRLGWGILMLGIFALALWRISTQVLLWLHRRLSGTPGTEFESLPGALKADLLTVLRGILWLLTLPFRLRHSRRPVAGLSPVRRVYRDLLRWAKSRGYPRHPACTPQEYLGALAGAVPGAAEDLRLITGQYSATRYGSQEPTDVELCQLDERWHRVKRNGLKKARNQPMRDGGNAR